jgi:hypothetical protein
MGVTRIRDIASILGKTEAANPSNPALGTGSGGGGVDSAGVTHLLDSAGIQSPILGSTPALLVDPGTTMYHWGQPYQDSDGTLTPPFVNAAQIRKGALVQVANAANTAATERSQFLYQNCFYLTPSADTGTDILRYTMLDRSDDAVPSSSEVYGRVNWICWAGGHTNATGNGSKHQIGVIDYNGASPTNGTSHTSSDGNAPDFAWTHSNFVSTLNVQGSGASSNVGYFTVYVQILFTHGAGSRGSAIYYKLEELV